MEEVRRVQITDAGRPVKWLNEIEWVEPEQDGTGEIWGMIWQTECVAQVAPVTGSVLGWVDFSGLARKAKSAARKEGRDTSQMDVLNGIAWDRKSGRLWVTVCSDLSTHSCLHSH